MSDVPTTDPLPPGRSPEDHKQIIKLADDVVSSLRHEASRSELLVRLRIALPPSDAMTAALDAYERRRSPTVLDILKQRLSATRNQDAVDAVDTHDPDWYAMLLEVRRSIVDNPRVAADICEALDWPRPFYLTLRDEVSEIDATRTLRDPDYRPPEVPATAGSLEHARQRKLVGLAFSGGGIRSATFNLGVLQGLASLDLVKNFDYLSTVSGGGYMGGWLASWIRRKGFRHVTDTLKSYGPNKDDPSALKPIQFLRQFSNYLTPKLGLFSADSWTLVAVYVRNVLLNLVTLVAGIAAVLILPRFLILATFHRQWRLFDPAKVAIAVVLLLTSLALVVVNLRSVTRDDPAVRRRRASWYSRQWAIQALGVVPILASAYLLSSPLWRVAGDVSGGATWLRWWWSWAIGFGIIAAFSGLLVQFFGGFRACYLRRAPTNTVRVVALMLLIAAVSGLVGAGLFRLLISGASMLHSYRPQGAIHFSVFGPPAVLAVVSLTTICGVGLMGLDFPDSGREWLSRFGAWMGIYALLWLALFGAAIYGPFAVTMVISRFWYKTATGLTLGWIATTISSILAARSSSTPRDPKESSSTVLDVVAFVGPPVFAVGFVVLIGLAVDILLSVPQGVHVWAYLHGTDGQHWALVRGTRFFPSSFADVGAWPFGFATPLFFFLALVTLVLSWRVDINEFSMHHFYKNRLVRCFLGASHERRRPNAFTGFDDRDDIPISQFVANPSPIEGVRNASYAGPYPIVNAALNYTAGAQLAWQQRKATSFVFTPLYCGFEPVGDNGAIDLAPVPRERRRRPSPKRIVSQLRSFGYRKTKQYAYPGDGIHLGTAVAISGAAVNPNQGYHSSPTVAFLLTVFDVRLGWWLGNPRSDVSSRKSSPSIGLMYLLKELLGMSDDRAGFVSLSDGGHFENLGIYELVRRRCSVIVASDAEQDGDLTFNGLAGAVRKCRTDFNVEITIDPSRIKKTIETPWSRTHCVVGSIRYPEDGLAPSGLLIYLKSSLTGEEPTDVLEYAASHAEFPHETTADQWFDESQFESYRRLGDHVATTTFEPARKLAAEPIRVATRGVFEAADRVWYPLSQAIELHATKHAQAYVELLEKLRAEPKLAFLDNELFPNSGLPTVEPTDDMRREAFYFCTAIIQLLEDVWFDFKLEDPGQQANPHVEGWMALYRRWIHSSHQLQRTWEAVHDTYNPSFQAFWTRIRNER